MFAAYTIIFAVIFLYVMFIWRRQRRLEQEVAALERRLEALGVFELAGDFVGHHKFQGPPPI